jgi:hypothetical protein
MNCGPGHMKCNYSCAYPDFSIQLNVSALLMEISRQFYERYTANLVPNTANNHQLTQCELWSQTYIMYLQLRLFRLHYSDERISAVIGDMSTIQRALYYKLGANTAHNLQFTQCDLWSRTYIMFYSSAYSGVNIQLKLSALILVI